MAVIAKKYAGQTDQIEPWYGTEFKVEKISQEKLENWKNSGFCDELKLPEKNEFIPTNFDIVPLDKDVRTATYNSFVCVYHSIYLIGYTTPSYHSRYCPVPSLVQTR